MSSKERPLKVSENLQDSFREMIGEQVNFMACVRAMRGYSSLTLDNNGRTILKDRLGISYEDLPYSVKKISTEEVRENVLVFASTASIVAILSIWEGSVRKSVAEENKIDPAYVRLRFIDELVKCRRQIFHILEYEFSKAPDITNISLATSEKSGNIMAVIDNLTNIMEGVKNFDFYSTTNRSEVLRNTPVKPKPASSREPRISLGSSSTYANLQGFSDFLQFNVFIAFLTALAVQSTQEASARALAKLDAAESATVEFNLSSGTTMTSSSVSQLKDKYDRYWSWSALAWATLADAAWSRMRVELANLEGRFKEDGETPDGNSILSDWFGYLHSVRNYALHQSYWTETSGAEAFDLCTAIKISREFDIRLK